MFYYVSVCNQSKILDQCCRAVGKFVSNYSKLGSSSTVFPATTSIDAAVGDSQRESRLFLKVCFGHAGQRVR